MTMQEWRDDIKKTVELYNAESIDEVTLINMLNEITNKYIDERVSDADCIACGGSGKAKAKRTN